MENRMKKVFMLPLFVVLVTATGFTQDFSISGEMKSGFYWERAQEGDMEPKEHVRLYNNDDAGSQQGRFRMNMKVDNGNIGAKVRFELSSWTVSNNQPTWPFAFAYGKFWDEQIKISAGKMGDSPWAAGGPERWDELDTIIGIRTELMPKFLPGLNIGFVLNNFNEGLNIALNQVLFGDIIQETVIGVSYTHDYFAFRFAFRGDSELDTDPNRIDEGSRLLYRVEERALQKILPGAQIWANGYFEGLDTPERGALYYNWVYFQYAPEAFTAQVRLGLDSGTEGRTVFHVRPSFYYNLFNNLLSVGASFSFCNNMESFNNAPPYVYWRIQPQVRMNWGSTYIALVYQYEDAYRSTKDTNIMTNWINLRLVYVF
jgi:hypothetical protein